MRYLVVQRNRLWAEIAAAAYTLVEMSNLVTVPT